MRKPLALLPSAVLLLVPAAPAAFAAPASGWSKEPTSFASLQFGKSLTDTVPECPDKYGSGAKSLCRTTISSGSYRIHALPGAMFQATARETNGLLSAVFWEVSDFQADRVIAALMQKYGQPTAREQRKVTLKSGATLDAEKLIWKGTDKVMIFDTFEDAENGVLTITTEAYRTEMREKTQQQIDEYAQAF